MDLIRIYVTVQPCAIPRGVVLQMQADPETVMRQTAFFTVCVHTFAAVKPGRLNCCEYTSMIP